MKLQLTIYILEYYIQNSTIKEKLLNKVINYDYDKIGWFDMTQTL